METFLNNRTLRVVLLGRIVYERLSPYIDSLLK